VADGRIAGWVNRSDHAAGLSPEDANVNYVDLSADPRRVDGAPLPWTLVLSTSAPSVFLNRTRGVPALTLCLVTSA
jgi:hypothetical protein